MENNANILLMVLQGLSIQVRKEIWFKEKIITNIVQHGEGDMNLLTVGDSVLINGVCVCVCV